MIEYDPLDNKPRYSGQDIAVLIAEKDARIKELEIIVQNRGMALEKRAEVHDENKALIAVLEERDAEIERLTKRVDYLERTHVEPEAWNAFEGALKIAQERAEAAERALANAKQQALREIIASLQQQDDVPK